MDQKVEIKQNEDKLTNHDAAAKKAITTLQEQLKTKVDQVSVKDKGLNKVYGLV